MAQLRCEDVMSRRPRTCTPTDSLLDGIRLMKEIDVGFVPVCEQLDGQLVGVLTDRDIAMAMARDDKPSQLFVRDIMTRAPYTCAPSDALEQCTRLMEQEQVRRVPIIDDARSLVGVVSMADVARHAPHRQELESQIARAEEAICQPSA
ncbi:MAG: hypothetical protein RL199_1292 [Pseudomonadota bacterium]|jgi:CBS domain-containing protein